MKIRIALLTIVFASSLSIGHAEEPPHPAQAYRLEYIHFNPTDQTIAWGVSEGMLTAEGQFAPKSSAVSYSLHLDTGVKERDGEARPMSPKQFLDATRVFQALAQLMQTYTDRWNDPSLSDQPTSEQDGSPEENGSEVRIVRIAAKAPSRAVSNSARAGLPFRTIAEPEEAFLPQTPLARSTPCVGSPVYPALHLTALAQAE
jgi:hypothetical protein